MPVNTAFVVVTFNLMILFVPVAAFLLWRWPNSWAWLMSLYLGLIVGLTDLRSDDPQLTLLLLVTLGMFIGFARPQGAWRWGLALGLWVPALGLAARAIGLTSAPLTDWLLSFVALVPAFIGAYGGAFLSRRSRPVEAKESQ